MADAAVKRFWKDVSVEAHEGGYGVSLDGRPIRTQGGHPQVVPTAALAEALAQESPHAFDVVTCMEMLEHVPDPAITVRACSRLLKPGGVAFFATINRNPKSYLFAVIGAEYILQLLPRGTHDYAKFIKPSELAGMCRESGLSMAGLMGMTYNPFSKTYALENDTSVNYILHCRSAAEP